MYGPKRKSTVLAFVRWRHRFSLRERVGMALPWLVAGVSASAQLPPPDILPFRYGED